MKYFNSAPKTFKKCDNICTSFCFLWRLWAGGSEKHSFFSSLFAQSPKKIKMFISSSKLKAYLYGSRYLTVSVEMGFLR